jgi:DNA polymerase III delta prime subunit
MSVAHKILYSTNKQCLLDYTRKLGPYKHFNVEKTIHSKLYKIPLFYSNCGQYELCIRDLRHYAKKLLPQIIDDLSHTQCIMTKQIKTLVLHSAEYLDQQTQYILRCIMETKPINLVFSTTKLNTLIGPIQSRCHIISLPNIDIPQGINKENKMFFRKLATHTKEDLFNNLYSLLANGMSIDILLEDTIEYFKDLKIVSLVSDTDSKIQSTTSMQIKYVWLQLLFLEIKLKKK